MLDLALRAVAETRRREIMFLVKDAEMSAGDIALNFEVSRPAISQHLKVLTEANLVSVRRQGTHRLYKARPEGLEVLRGFLSEFWLGHLRALKEVAEAEQRRSIALDN